MLLTYLKGMSRSAKDWFHDAIEEEEKLLTFDPISAASAASATFTVLSQLSPIVRTLFSKSNSIKTGVSKIKEAIGLPGKIQKKVKQVNTVVKKTSQTKPMNWSKMSLDSLAALLNDKEAYQKLSKSQKSKLHLKMRQLNRPNNNIKPK